LLIAEGLGPGGPDGEALLVTAASNAEEKLRGGSVETIPHVAAWRDAYRSFGAKPQRTRNSLEALLRRVPSGLPRINPLTDLYNAISVIHLIPVGGEDLDRYAGPPRLIRARGSEPFDTVSDGAEVVEHPDEGEVVWCDDEGVTCRRWNWRQARRTQLRDETTTALFIFDALEPVDDETLNAAVDDLHGHLLGFGPDVQIARRFLAPDPRNVGGN
jgi:DNA/RNA-binding domain of Phe-tRNA-synthetase-like protein